MYKTRTNAQLSELRLKNDSLSSRLEDLQSQHDQTIGHLAALKQEHLQQSKRLEGDLGDATRQVESLKGWQRRAQSMAIELEEQKRINEKLRQGKEAEVGGAQTGDDTLKNEIKRDYHHIFK